MFSKGQQCSTSSNSNHVPTFLDWSVLWYPLPCRSPYVSSLYLTSNILLALCIFVISRWRIFTLIYAIWQVFWKLSRETLNRSTEINFKCNNKAFLKSWFYLFCLNYQEFNSNVKNQEREKSDFVPYNRKFQCKKDPGHVIECTIGPVKMKMRPREL